MPIEKLKMAESAEGEDSGKTPAEEAEEDVNPKKLIFT